MTDSTTFTTRLCNNLIEYSTCRPIHYLLHHLVLHAANRLETSSHGLIQAGYVW